LECRHVRGGIPVPPKPQYCSTLRSILQNEDTKDLTLKVGEQSLKVHSLFLTEQGSEFAALVRKQINHVAVITDLSFNQLQSLVDFVYSDVVEELQENVEEIYPAATKVFQLKFRHLPYFYLLHNFQYKLIRLQRICERALYIKAGDVSNSLTILKIAKSDLLLNQIVGFIAK
jgi:hypothetical protein